MKGIVPGKGFFPACLKKLLE
ncbi:hypothetical protein Gohar_021577, partial [Gossypium harknessii]|nr:hypothetical protein [Gossypium harknessii]